MPEDEIRQFTVIGTDTTTLQSAWSAVNPCYYHRLTENRAARAFMECAQRYVYYRRLLAPIPGKEEGITNPLMELWFDTKSETDHPNETALVKDGITVNLEQLEEPALLEAFANDLLNDSNYRPWLQFQLSKRVTEEYTSRIFAAERDPSQPIDEAHELVSARIAAGHLSKVHQSLGGIELASWHEKNCKARFKSDVASYAISYAYSLFRRGRQYGIKMRGKSYTPHWSRIAAQCLPGIDSVESASHEFDALTDWGEIVYALVQEGFVERNAHAITDLLRSIRASVQSGNFRLHKSATLDQVKILESAGINARFSRNAPSYAKLTSLPQGLVESIPSVGQAVSPLLRVITFLGNNPLIEKIDARLTRMFMWDAYQKAFYIPEVVGEPPEEPEEEK